MVESADEPPLRGLHSWAKSKTSLIIINPFKSKKGATTSSDTPQPVLPQHAGHIEADRAGNSIASAESNANVENTQQPGTSVVDTQGNGADSPSMTMTEADTKPPVFKRFVRDVKRIITSSWVNWLLVFVPVGIILGALNDWAGMHFVSPSVIFAINAVAIIPLASMLAFATESVAVKMGDSWGALLNVTFGNAVEIIIFVIALAGGEVRIVQAAALGSILSNLLLILGMCFVFGGLRFREQVYNSSVSQMSACLLSLSVISLLLPTAFHAAFANSDRADKVVLKVSRGTSVVLLLVYVLYLIFQLKSHAFMYESTPQHVIDEESHPGILADMLNSSSSSSDDSSSSSSDSDATADSYKASSRIKRALRRKRRKSSSGTKNDVPLQPLNTNGALSTEENPSRNTRMVGDEVQSGDEADVEHRRGRTGTQYTMEARDFQDENTSVRSSRRKHRKTKKSRAKKSKPALEELDHANMVSEKAVASTQPNIASETQQTATDALRRPFHIRQLSTAVKPAFNSTVFPHHEACGRQLALPVVRSQDRPVVINARRASSMPDINRRAIPNTTSAYPQPITVMGTVPIEIVTEDAPDAPPHLSRTSAVVLLLCTTGLVALCAEFLVGSIDYLVSNSGIGELFVGLIILPIVGNAAEHVTAVTVAYKNKMDLAINIALGSSIQIALFVTPLMVILGWIIHQEMSLYFSLFETMSLFSSAFIVNYLVIDGRSNYLEGTLLIAAYVIIAIAAFFYPDCGLSATSGSGSSASC